MVKFLKINLQLILSVSILSIFLGSASFAQEDSSITTTPTVENNKDSVFIELPAREDSMSSNISAKQDTIIIETQDSSDTFPLLEKIIEDSVENDTLSMQDSININIEPDSVTVDTTYLEDIHPQDISDQSG